MGCLSLPEQIQNFRHLWPCLWLGIEIFSTAMCGTVFRYSCGNVRNAILRLIKNEEANDTGDCKWQMSFLQPFVHQGCASAVSVWGSDKHFGAVLLASSILLLFRYVGSAYAVHLRHLEKGALCCPRSRAGQRRGSGSCPRWLEESRDRAAEERTGTRAAACGDVKLGWSDRELRLLRLEHA